MNTNLSKHIYISTGFSSAITAKVPYIHNATVYVKRVPLFGDNITAMNCMSKCMYYVAIDK